MGYPLRKSVLPDIETPKPRTQVIVNDVDPKRRKIKFHATQAALREIKAKGYGILNERPGSGWCVLIVNRCYKFEEVYAWLLNVQTECPDDE